MEIGMNIEMVLQVIAAAILVLIMRDEWREIRTWWKQEKRISQKRRKS